MATRSSITVKREDGKYVSVYCHFDGYTSHVGKLLFCHYNTYEKALALVSLGHLSSLDASIECPPGHSYDTRVDGYTVCYGRDRGETDQAPIVESCIEGVRLCNFQQYNYLFQDGKWYLHGKQGYMSELTFDAAENDK